MSQGPDSKGFGTQGSSPEERGRGNVEERSQEIAELNELEDEYWENRIGIETHQNGGIGQDNNAAQLGEILARIVELRKRLGLPEFDTENRPDISQFE